MVWDTEAVWLRSTVPETDPEPTHVEPSASGSRDPGSTPGSSTHPLLHLDGIHARGISRSRHLAVCSSDVQCSTSKSLKSRALQLDTPNEVFQARVMDAPLRPAIKGRAVGMGDRPGPHQGGPERVPSERPSHVTHQRIVAAPRAPAEISAGASLCPGLSSWRSYPLSRSARGSLSASGRARSCRARRRSRRARELGLPARAAAPQRPRS